MPGSPWGADRLRELGAHKVKGKKRRRRNADLGETAAELTSDLTCSVIVAPGSTCVIAGRNPVNDCLMALVNLQGVSVAYPGLGPSSQRHVLSPTHYDSLVETSVPILRSPADLHRL